MKLMSVRSARSRLFGTLAAATALAVVFAGLASTQGALAATDPDAPSVSVPASASAARALAEAKARLAPTGTETSLPEVAQDTLRAQATASASTSVSGGFTPGNLISDANFYNGSALSAGDIQSFLSAAVPVCRNGYICLKDFVQNTTTFAADKNCATYAGAANESAATIIAKVGAACGISQKALLVLLQKEQGLVTDTWPVATQYAQATGYSCPDTSACDPGYAGFFTQVYRAAWQFKEYLGSTYFTWFPVGKTSAIAYNPKGSCGSGQVTIWNNATAALYYYTPYQPNAAAIANYPSDGDSCSAYGNSNFWGNYTDWFGSATSGSVPSVTRVYGDNRYDTAVAVSQKAYPSGSVPVVYIATGANFPDALGAAAAAASQKGPLLLVAPDSVPASVDAELRRLTPGRIVVVGGTSAINDTVYGELRQRVASETKISRLNGADRYATSRMIAGDAFQNGASAAYIATGANFPDALSAGAVAGSKHAPVILVDGAEGSLDSETLDLFTRLGVSTATIVGGPNAIGDAVEVSLRAKVTNVTRYSGDTRFETSAKLNHASFPNGAPTVFLATGYSFPDALAGAAAAGAANSPLYVVQTSCVPSAAASDVFFLKAAGVELLGGTAALADTVGQLRDCQ
jgi:putative cell wall-binding protein